VAAPAPGRRGPLRDLDRPADAFASLGPNWFASVMGTGIVATAAATLPVHWPGLRVFGTAIWLLAAAWLAVLAVAEVIHWTRYRQAALGHARNPVMVQFYGAPPMAMLTVGAGALLLAPGPVRGGWRGSLLRPAGAAGNHADEVAPLTPAAE
jgi:tellurite resistance protein TehA-like permease